MKPLIPQELCDQFRDVNLEVEHCKDMLLWCKLFDPSSSWTWYVADYDPDTKVAFGYVEWLEKERGDFYLPELEEYKGKLGIGIERDIFYQPQTYTALFPSPSADV